MALRSRRGGRVEVEKHPGQEILDQAIKIYYGEGDEIEDQDEAVRLLYRQRRLTFLRPSPRLPSISRTWRMKLCIKLLTGKQTLFWPTAKRPSRS